MKQYSILFAFVALLFASHTVEAQAVNNVYRYSYDVSVAADVSHYREIPATLLSLWTLGGSFSVTNTGAGPDDFVLQVFGTSDPDVSAASAVGWQLIKSTSVAALAAAATSYQGFRDPTEMFYLGHTRLLIQVTSNGDEPGTFAIDLVLKKQ